jgi:hypothetical protein
MTMLLRLLLLKTRSKLHQKKNIKHKTKAMILKSHSFFLSLKYPNNNLNINRRITTWQKIKQLKPKIM